MPRVRRRSFNDIYNQNERIQQLALETRNSSRARRAGNIAARYAQNIARLQGGGTVVRDPNQRYTRNQYAGQSRGSVGG